MRSPSVPREEVVNRLARVFRSAGFDRASLSDLAAETGLQRSSLYHFFPAGKKQMAEAVLAHANQVFEADVLQKLAGDAPPRERFQAMVRSIERYYRNGEEACLLGLFAVERQGGELGRLIRAGFRRWRSLLDALFREAGAGRAEAEARADEVIAVIQGALVLSRGLGDTRVFRSQMKMLAKRAFA